MSVKNTAVMLGAGGRGFFMEKELKSWIEVRYCAEGLGAELKQFRSRPMNIAIGGLGRRKDQMGGWECGLKP